MKKLFTCLFLAATLLNHGSITAQCNVTASLTATPVSPGSMTYMFVGNTTGITTSQYLQISNLFMSSQDTTYYTFTSGGVYQVCFSAYDSSMVPACAAQDCIDSLVVGNPSNSCGTNLSYLDQGAGSIMFYTWATTPNNWTVSFSWDFGDGSSANLNTTYTAHYYQLNGTYTVSCTTWAYDPADTTQYCYGTTSLVVNVQGVPASSCNAYFSLWPDSLNPSVYYGYNYSSGSNLTYLWDFGDGTSSTQAFPSHTYTNPGNYLICLTVADSLNNCTSNYCDSAATVRMNSMGITSLTILDPANPTSVKENNQITSAVVFPNPAEESVTLNIVADEALKLQITMIDVLGQTIHSVQANCYEGTNSLQLNTSQLAKGTYFVRLTCEGKTLKTIKLIK
jgi:PKD repeat protein